VDVGGPQGDRGKGKRGKRNQPQYGCSRNRPGEASECSYRARRYWHADPLEEEVWESLVRWMDAARRNEANWPYFPRLVDDDLAVSASYHDHLQERIAGLDEAISAAQADLYDPGKPDATEEAIRVLQNRRRALTGEALELEQVLAGSVRQREREALIDEADQLAGITDPDERRRVLTRAGLRVKLWEEPFTLWEREYWWRWSK